MSLDGFIAKHDDSIDFLSIVETPNEDFGYTSFLQSIDTVIWGRKTFEKVLSFGEGIPHREKTVYVISRSRKGQYENAIYHNDLVKLIGELKEQAGKDIYCDGGSEIVFELLKSSLLDRIIISVIPHLLGDGIRLFKEGLPEQNMKLKQSISFPSGLVQLWYDVER